MIIDILNEKGIKDASEEYESRISKSDMVSELTIGGTVKKSSITK
jgi:hypothetical protein